MTQSLTTAPDPTVTPHALPAALTLVMPLRAKASISLDDFYDYWLNAHDAAALDALAANETWARTTDALALVCSAVHACRVDRTTTTKHDGRITLTGIRGVQVADLIRRLRADSQDAASVRAMFLPDAAAVPAS